MAYVVKTTEYQNGPKLFFEKIWRKYGDAWKAYHEQSGEWPLGMLFNQSPLPPDGAEAYVCLEDGVTINLEFWGIRRNGTDSTFVRLTAEAGMFNKAHVNAVLDSVISYISQPQGQGVSTAAFATDAFTWIGDWDWTTEQSDPGHWGIQKLNEVLATSPRGLCAFDGTLMSPGSGVCKFAFLDTPHRTAYLGYDYLGMTPDTLEWEFVQGCGKVPLTDVSGMQALKTSTEVYSAGISPDGRNLAIIQYSNSIEFGCGYISIIDVNSRTERKLTWFDHASGGEQISYSPDNKWLLVPRTHDDAGALIIDAATGASRSFNDLNRATCWWVIGGHLGLLSFGRGSYRDADFDPCDVSFFDLTTGQMSSVVRIVPPEFTLDPLYRYYWQPEPRADGNILLSMMVPPIANDQYNAHTVIGMLDLHTGVVRQITQAFADPDGYIMRKPKNWHWNSPLDMTVAAPPSLLDGTLSRVDIAAWPAFSDEYGAVLKVSFDSPFFTGQI